MSFLQLCESASVLDQCEYYFKRYDFGGRTISRQDHARNMCEFYLGNIYTLRSRLKKFLNNLVQVCPEVNINVGATIKSFDKVFDQELRMRNRVTHHEPFSDLAIERISLTRLLAGNQTFKKAGVEELHLRTYRDFMKSWSQRTRIRSDIVHKLLDEIAKTLVERASFLAEK